MRLAGLAAVVILIGTAAFAATPMIKLLPVSTQGCLLTPDVQLLQEKFDQTEYGKWLDDPLMKPYLDDLRKEARDESNPDRISYGLTWDDVKDIGRGEAALALVDGPERRPVRVVLVDVTGNYEGAKQVLQKIFNALYDRSKPANQRATTYKHETVQGEKMTIFYLPANPKDPQRPQKTAYFLMRNILGAVEDDSVARGIMNRIAGTEGREGPLESVQGFQIVMRRLDADAAKTNAGAPDVRLYLNPLPYAEARRELDREFLRDGRVDLLKTLQNSGFKGIKAIGGYAHLSAKPYDVVNRLAVYAPPPLERTLAGIKTPNVAPKALAPPGWVPASVSSFSSGSINLPLFLNEKHAGPLYDFTIGDGNGAWKDTLEGIRTDERGPQVDLQTKLFANTGDHVVRATDVAEPITINSERRLIAAELTKPDEALAALEAFYANDKTADKQTAGSQSYWEIWPEKRKPDSIPSGVAVAHGHLLYATQAEMLKAFFAALSQEKQLTSDADYKEVLEHIQVEAARRGWDKLCVLRFLRSREAYRPTFEITRQGKLPTSDTLLSSLLNMSLGQESGGKPRKQRTDGALLPEYSKVAHYFLPAGSLGIREDAEGQEFQGWFLVGFSLGKSNGGVAKRIGE